MPPQPPPPPPMPQPQPPINPMLNQVAPPGTGGIAQQQFQGMRPMPGTGGPMAGGAYSSIRIPYPYMEKAA